MFYFLQLILYVILKGTGIRLVYVLPQPLSQWQSFAISHFYGLTFKLLCVTPSLGFKDTELILWQQYSKHKNINLLYVDYISLLF